MVRLIVTKGMVVSLLYVLFFIYCSRISIYCTKRDDEDDRANGTMARLDSFIRTPAFRMVKKFKLSVERYSSNEARAVE